MGKHGSIAVSAVSFVLALACGGSADELPVGHAPPALEFKHFPDRLHTFVWRNWEMVSREQMADVLGTTPEKVRAVGESMGLPPHSPPPPEHRQRGYISLIRRNWHLLPYDQLLQLLGWDAEKLAFTLKEDDFLWVKLGLLKPSCPPLRYEEPTDATVKRREEIRGGVASNVGEYSLSAVGPGPRALRHWAWARKRGLGTIAGDEIQNARRLFVLTREDSRIGFEASNHYYYLPLDLVEKVLNCEYLLNTWLPGLSGGSAQP